MGISENSNSFTFATTPRFRVHKNPIFLGADKIGFHSFQTLGLLDTPKYHIMYSGLIPFLSLLVEFRIWVIRLLILPFT